MQPTMEPLLQGLRDLFYKPDYRTDVTVQEFIGKCQEHIKSLPTVYTPRMSMLDVEEGEGELEEGEQED